MAEKRSQIEEFEEVEIFVRCEKLKIQFTDSNFEQRKPTKAHTMWELHERTNKNRVLYDADRHRGENLTEEIFIGCSKGKAASEIDEEEEEEP